MRETLSDWLDHNRRMTWEPGPGIVELPDGTRLRGRGLRQGEWPQPQPEWGLYLLGRRPATTPWPSRWLRWPDFWLPLDDEQARSAFEAAHRLAGEGCRVEIACGGGRGRTGTALACIAQLGGVAADEATAWVRENFDPRAVETPWQRRYVRRFSACRSSSP
jgi:protein-tyrosine phosphatase